MRANSRKLYRTLQKMFGEYMIYLNDKPVLLVCDKDNIGSVKSIINNGGVLENEVLKEGKLIQRYWILL